MKATGSADIELRDVNKQHNQGKLSVLSLTIDDRRIGSISDCRTYFGVGSFDFEHRQDLLLDAASLLLARPFFRIVDEDLHDVVKAALCQRYAAALSVATAAAAAAFAAACCW